MNKSSILAHRGLFWNSSEKNSQCALTRALQYGFGIETDLRDLNGQILISHDPPQENIKTPDLKWFLEQVHSCRQHGRIALNIKADGLCRMIKSLSISAKIDRDRFFVFDMSVPDSLSYLKEEIPIYSRISEYEPNPSFLEQVKGIWIDNFTGDFPQVQRAEGFIKQGIRTTIVSSELHGRDHTALWRDITESGIHRSPLFEICTDFPLEASAQFCEV